MFNSGFTNKTAYKVIRPFNSQKLHYSSSLEGGASKCYREVKALMPNSNDFSVMNMSTNELMRWAYSHTKPLWLFNYDRTDQKDVGGMSREEIRQGLSKARFSLRKGVLQ